MKIALLPYFTSNSNPYLTELASALKGQRHDVRLHTVRRWHLFPLLRAWGADVVHVHWLHPLFVRRSLIEMLLAGAGTLASLMIMKLAGARIVWTAHDLLSHESPHRTTERLFTKILAKMFDRVIVHSDEARARLIEAYGVDSTVIPHGEYIGVYPNTLTREQCRLILSVKEDEDLYVHLGMIRRYKRIPDLIQAFADMPANARLVITGKPWDDALKQEIAAFAAQDSRVMVLWGYVPPVDVQVFCKAANAMVMAHEGLTSGVAALAKAFDAPLVDGAFQPIPYPPVLPWREVAAQTIEAYGVKVLAHA